MRHKHKSEAD